MPPLSASSASLPRQPSILLGIGTGCCGLAALAQRLQQQPDAAVSYEDRPLLPWRWLGGGQTLRERFARWRRTRSGRIVGDVGSFYLPYVEEAIALEPEIHIVCLRCPRDEVVRGLADWLDRVQPLPTDHWSEKPAAGWHHDPIRTRLFPQYPTDDREAGIGRYWDEYHAMVEDLARRFPEQLRVFDARRALHSDDGYREMLTFAGFSPEGAGGDPGLPLDEPGQPPGARRARRASAHLLDPARCVVLVPFAGQIYPQCERALKELERRGYTVQRVGGYAAIDQGRNQMATDALLAGFEETMWIDADIDFHPDAVERLRSHQQPIVCGIYPQKGKRALACHILPGTDKMVFGQGGGLTELLYGATGFLLVRRQVYETMQRVLPLPVCNERFGSPMIPFFQPLSHADGDGHWYLAEDYAFCQRARQCGFPILADTTVRLWHLGNYAFGWEDAGMERQRNATFVLHFPK